MSRRDERELAARLARVLDGQERGQDEVAALVTLLERATEPARFEVAEDIVERELARVRPCARGEVRAPRGAPRLALAFGAIAAAAVALLVFTFVRLPGVDVEGRALAALGGDGTVLKIEERIDAAVPGTFRASTRTVWLDPSRGLARWSQIAQNLRVEETLVEPGRIVRYLPEQNLVVVGSSCRAFASGCADAVDPVAFYRRALEGAGTVRSKRERSVYRLTLPLQELPDAVRVEQRVTIDATTFLPTSIEWREQRPGGQIHTVSRVVIESIERIPRGGLVQDVFQLQVPPNVRVEQRTASREPIKTPVVTRLSLAAARRIRPPLLWFGREHPYRPLRSIEKLQYAEGAAYRLRYGGVTVWNYAGVVPPELLSSRFGGPGKTIPVGDDVVHFYSAGARLVAELDRAGRSVAVVAPEYVKEDLIAALQLLRPLR